MRFLLSFLSLIATFFAINIVAITTSLKPSQAPRVGVLTGDDIIVSVTIKIVDQNLRAAQAKLARCR